jgi:peptide/nickel transport system ATP-binding protein
MRLLPFNGRIVSGKIYFDGLDILKMNEEKFRKELRWKRMSIIFQGAMNSLNPVFRVEDQIVQVIRSHEDVSKEVARERVKEFFSKVGINPDRTRDYPHQFSGGMKQRIMIAMALACNPSFVIADEPVTALDVIVQAQILELMRNLREKLKLSMILITHDLSVIAELCNKVAIMYAGKIVEQADIVSVFKNPLHPYTQGLIANFPSVREEKTEFKPISGAPPNLMFPPSGCRFHPRCPFVMEICTKEEPEAVQVKRGHYVACHMKL